MIAGIKKTAKKFGKNPMKWTSEAETSLKKVPFFIRKKVKNRIEDQVSEAGKETVSMADVKAAKARFLNSMESEIKGYQLDACFGRDGCSNRANESEDLFFKLESLFKKEDLLSHLKQRVDGGIKFHHEFRVSIADCPNACSQPQIKDIGIIGAVRPFLTDQECSLCNACVEICREDAIVINHEEKRPVIDFDRCLECGQCVTPCPTGTITEKIKGFRVQLGGKLGRHPKLAEELPAIYSEDEIIDIVKECIGFYRKNSRRGERFSELYNDSSFLNSLYLARNER